MRRFPPHHQPTRFPYAADLLPPRLARYANSDDQTLLNDAITSAVTRNRTFLGSTARFEAKNKCAACTPHPPVHYHRPRHHRHPHRLRHRRPLLPLSVIASVTTAADTPPPQVRPQGPAGVGQPARVARVVGPHEAPLAPRAHRQRPPAVDPGAISPGPLASPPSNVHPTTRRDPLPLLTPAAASLAPPHLPCPCARRTRACGSGTGCCRSRTTTPSPSRRASSSRTCHVRRAPPPLRPRPSVPSRPTHRRHGPWHTRAPARMAHRLRRRAAAARAILPLSRGVVPSVLLRQTRSTPPSPT